MCYLCVFSTPCVGMCHLSVMGCLPYSPYFQKSFKMMRFSGPRERKTERNNEYWKAMSRNKEEMKWNEEEMKRHGKDMKRT